MTRPWLWKTALAVAAVLLVGVVTPAAGQQDPAAGLQDPASGRAVRPPPPPNDDVADAIQITGPGISPSVRLTRTASIEDCEYGGDPEHPWLIGNYLLGLPWLPAGNKTIWWTWVPDRTGWVTVDTGLSQGPAVAVNGGGVGPFDTVLGVHQGRIACTSVFESRSRLVTWDDDSGRAYMSRVRFRAYEGARYYIVVDGGDRGGQTCRFRAQPVTAHVQCYPTVGGDVVVRLRYT